MRRGKSLCRAWKQAAEQQTPNTAIDLEGSPWRRESCRRSQTRVNQRQKGHREEKDGGIEAEFVTDFSHPVEQLRSVLHITVQHISNGRLDGSRMNAVVGRDRLVFLQKTHVHFCVSDPIRNTISLNKGTQKRVFPLHLRERDTATAYFNFIGLKSCSGIGFGLSSTTGRRGRETQQQGTDTVFPMIPS